MRQEWLVVAGLCLSAGVAHARGPFVGQLPNGNVHSCKNCHTEAAGDSPLNPFGQLAATRTAPGTIDWPAYARTDSDGDGFTNGQELGDPCGSWTPGQVQPTIAAAGNPGEAGSTPTSPPANDCPSGGSSSSSSSGGDGAGPGCSTAGTGSPSAVLALLAAVLWRRRR